MAYSFRMRIIKRQDFYVYAWLRPDGSPFYIGKGQGNRDKTIKTNNQVFQRILDKIAKAGEEPVIVRLHENLTEDMAFLMEREEIARYGRRNNSTGILANLTDGGEGTTGRIHSDETKVKLRVAHTGKTASDETKAKMSAVRIGKMHTEQAKDKIRDAHTGRPKSAEHCANISISKTNPSPETRARIGAAHRGKTISLDIRAKTALSIHMKPPMSGSYKGVNFDTGRGKWLVRIKVDGRHVNLGRYTTPEDAALAYDIAAIDAWGIGNCYLNLPTPSTALAA